MTSNLISNSDFKQWVVDLKVRIRQSQLKAAVSVNSELLRLYWELGCDIVLLQMDSVWGSGFFEQLSKELKAEFPTVGGFSERNLYNMKQFYLFYTKNSHNPSQLKEEACDNILQQAVAKLENKDITQPTDNFHITDDHLIFQIPWGHNIQIFSRCYSVTEALFYVRKTIQNGWSRAMLMNFIEANLYHSQGKTLNNFNRLLPDVQGDLA